MTTITQSKTDICSTCSINLNFHFFLNFCRICSCVFDYILNIYSDFRFLFLSMSVLELHTFGNSKVTTRPSTIFFVKVKISDSDLPGRSMDLTI